MTKYKIAIASDHAGFFLKKELLEYLIQSNYSVMDLGTSNEESVDYPEFGHKAARAILDGKADFGIICCGTGIGIGIVANKHQGVRAAVCHNVLTARFSRAHNDANILALGSRVIDINVAKECLKVFLSTPFEGGRHERRIEQIELI
ncbi:ribose 5-phosphate isomerase B [Alphaproteobacteria bacterium]|nr:ribose 5-phosphate isomerase B [Alphaproteobacteria bacterium]